jgi:tetratricopeptide (TPR) repeat protein
MLQNKLEKASQEAKRKRAQFAASLLIITALVTLWFLGVINIDLTFFDRAVDKGRDSVTSATNNSALTLKDNALEEGLNHPSQQIVSTLPIDQKLSLLSNDFSKLNELREAFKEALLEFENSIEPLVSSKGFSNWNIEEQQKILTQKAESITAFSLGDYEQALVRLKKASENSRTLITKLDTSFEEALSKARTLYGADDYDASFLSISDALQLKPQSHIAQDLKKKISRLPKVLENIQKAAVARTENNLDIELKYLREAIDSDPSRLGLINRLGVVKKDIIELKFANFIKKGLANVDQKNAEASKSYLRKARSIFNESSEVELLAKKVKRLVLDLEVERLVKEAKVESEADNWPKAELLYLKARKIQPNRKNLEDGYALAEKINILSGKLAYHLQAPHRLSSPNVAEIARILAVEAMTVSSKSYLIADQTTKLLEFLKAYSTKVQVKVISNGVTNISVRGVGKVGLTNEKTIDLKPGKYTFEGKRTGYRSKLIQVEVPLNAGSIIVEIVSDERI